MGGGDQRGFTPHHQLQSQPQWRPPVPSQPLYHQTGPQRRTAGVVVVVVGAVETKPWRVVQAQQARDHPVQAPLPPQSPQGPPGPHCPASASWARPAATAGSAQTGAPPEDGPQSWWGTGPGRQACPPSPAPCGPGRRWWGRGCLHPWVGVAAWSHPPPRPARARPRGAGVVGSHPRHGCPCPQCGHGGPWG